MQGYQIRIGGQLDESWSDWFNDWTLKRMITEIRC
jgi:hypothetical protein